MSRRNARPIASFDWAIKTILCDNAGVLEGFLSALLNCEITVIELLESESNRPDDETKYNRVDLLANEEVVADVQYESELGYLKRLACGASKVIVENLRIGGPYDNLKREGGRLCLLRQKYLYRSAHQKNVVSKGSHCWRPGSVNKR